MTKIFTSNSPQVERQNFSTRLQQVAYKAGLGETSPAEVARQFNARSSETVTAHAVRKWFLAEAIPKQNHVKTLAHWLACDAAWLRYGVGRETVVEHSKTSEDLLLLQDLALLDPTAKQLVYGLVSILLSA